MKGIMAIALLLVVAHAQYYYDYDTYVRGRQYENGDRVRVGTKVWECRRPPHNRFCHNTKFRPNGPHGHMAWMEATEITIKAEQKDFNLPEYTRYYSFKMDEYVQFRGNVYKCIAPLLCGNADTMPGTDLAANVWLEVSVYYTPNPTCRGSSLIDNAKGSNISPYEVNRAYSYGDRVILNS